MSTFISIFAGIAFGTVLLVVAAPSVAAAAPSRAPKISFDRAAQIAVEHVPDGVVEDIERDRRLGRVVYEVEVLAPDGREHDLVIDANDGRIVTEEVDD